jgi:DedD protein
MAFFKFRKGGDEQPAPAAATESVEVMRTRARHRLIGASVLVLLGVIGFPLLFDSQPRPISVDIPIEIPDKNTVKPLASVGPSTPASHVIVETEAGTKTIEPASVPAVPAVKVAAKPESKAIEKPVDKPADKPAEKVADKVADKVVARDNDGAKAQALLEGKTVESAASAPSGARFVVQIGAYSDAAKAQEARLKLEKAGLKTYTQVVQPKEGKRIRVRVGPFESKAAADKVAEKIKKLDLPASILEL